MIKKKIVTLGMAAALLLGVVVPASVMAGDDNYEFNYTILANKNNQRSDPRYRETKNISNTWKVKMTSSEEGKGTITKYWLEAKSGTNVSPSIKVKQGAGAYYTETYSSASQTNVYLTAENNNYTNKIYNVKGFWDEETGKIK